MTDFDFDMQAAWIRRFSEDATSNLGAFARRLKEALPELVQLEEKKGLFAKTSTVTGVTVTLGQNQYRLTVEKGRLSATIAMIVHGVTLSTKAIDPADWFAKLATETKAASAHAQSLSASLQQFMES